MRTSPPESVFGTRHQEFECKYDLLYYIMEVVALSLVWLCVSRQTVFSTCVRFLHFYLLFRFYVTV